MTELHPQGRLDAMRKVEFGRTDLSVTPLCIGTASLGDMPEDFGFSVSKPEAARTLRRAFSSGCNFIDTASVYGDSEERIGDVLRDIGGLPEGFVLATKADRDLQTGDFSAAQVRKSVALSRERLGMASLQLVYLHDPEHSSWSFDQIMGKGGPVEALVELKEQGVIQHIGIAGGPIDLLRRFIEVSDVFEAVLTHNRFNLLYRTADPLLTFAAEKGIAVVNAAPFASGIFAKGSNAYPRFAYKKGSSEILERIRRIEAVCKKHDVSLRAAALQFSLRDSRITSTIAGMASPEEIDQAFADLEIVIPPEFWKDIEQFTISEGDPEA